MDSRTGRSTVRANPPGCPDLESVGAGELLYQCEGAGTLENAATGSLVTVTWPPEPHPISPPFFVGVGSRWVEAAEFAYKQMRRVFIDWHSGAVVYPHESLEQFTDLDASQPLQRYCPPFRSSEPSLGGPAPGEFSGRELPTRLPFVFTAEQRTHATATRSLLVLRRCGSPQHVVLGADAGGAIQPGEFGVEFGGDTVTWETEGDAWLTQLSTRSRRWHGPVYRLRPRLVRDSERGRAFAALRATSSVVFETRPYRHGELVEVYAARIPGSRGRGG